MAKKVTRKQICEAFKNAVNYLTLPTESCYYDPRKTSYVCFAISRNICRTNKAQVAARKVIMQRLNGYGDVQDWLENRGVHHSMFTHVNLQEYRHRWLQELIKEFSA